MCGIVRVPGRQIRVLRPLPAPLRAAGEEGPAAGGPGPGKATAAANAAAATAWEGWRSTDAESDRGRPGPG